MLYVVGNQNQKLNSLEEFEPKSGERQNNLKLRDFWCCQIHHYHSLEEQVICPKHQTIDYTVREDQTLVGADIST